MRDGLLVRPNAQGAYGDGVYFASKADRRYGGAVVQARIGAQHPFLVRERQFLDMAHFERQVAPLVERFQTAQPSAAAGLEQGALIRAALRDAGHDAIIVSRRPWEAKWLIALDDVPAANLTRVQ